MSVNGPGPIPKAKGADGANKVQGGGSPHVNSWHENGGTRVGKPLGTLKGAALAKYKASLHPGAAPLTVEKFDHGGKTHYALLGRPGSKPGEGREIHIYGPNGEEVPNGHQQVYND